MLINPTVSAAYFFKQLSFKRKSTYLIAVFACLGFILSFFQVFGTSPDYSQYIDFFNLARVEGLSILVVSRFEPAFSVFSLALISVFADNAVIYSSIVATTMLLKGWAINAIASSSRIFFLVATFYFVRYFSLHELTQLRSACAIALVMVGATYLWGSNLRRGLFFCAAATLFQISAAAVIPALFVTAAKRSTVILIGVGVYAVAFVYAEVLSGYFANFIPILDLYKTYGFSQDKTNPFAVQLLIDWAMITVSLIMWRRLNLLMKRIVLLQLIGIAIFYGAIDFGVVSHRLREFYSVFWVFYVADGLRLKSTRPLSYCFVFVCFGFYSYVFFISGKFFS